MRTRISVPGRFSNGKGRDVRHPRLCSCNITGMRPNFLGLLMALAFSALTASAQLEPLVQTLERGDVEQRRSALANIRNLRSESASRTAIPALKDKNVMVRATAASSVVFLPHAEAASVLIPMLNDRDEFVRREAAFALGEV